MKRSLFMILACHGLVSGMLLAASFPYVGEVTAAKVNIRAGASTNYTILTLAEKGEQLIVTGARGQWLQVEAPERCRVFISRKYVDEHGTVTGDRVNVRAKATLKGEVMIQLNRGSHVDLEHRRKDWYEIHVPDGCHAWIFGKFVRRAGSVEDLRRREKKTAEISQTFVEAERRYREEMGKENIADWNLAPVLKLYRKVAAEVDDPVVREKARARTEDLETKLEVQTKYLEILKESEMHAREIARIEQKYKPLLAMVGQPDEPLYDGIGELQSMGRVWNQPTTYKLIKGTEVLCYVRSANPKLDLEDFLWKQIGVRGQTTKPDAFDRPLILVQEIEEITAGE